MWILHIQSSDKIICITLFPSYDKGFEYSLFYYLDVSDAKIFMWSCNVIAISDRIDKIVIVYFVPEYKFKQFTCLLTVSACYTHFLQYF